MCASAAAGSVVAVSVPSTSGFDDRVEIVASGKNAEVRDLRGVSLAEVQARPRDGGVDDDPSVRALRQFSSHAIGAGDFRVEATIILEALDGKGAGIVFDGGVIELDDPTIAAVLVGSLFGGGRLGLEGGRPYSFQVGAPIDVSIVRSGREVLVSINGEVAGSIGMEGIPFGRVGFDLAGGRMRVLTCSAEGALEAAPLPRAVFTGADGDIDEYRDPTAATDGRKVLVAAIGVGVNPDGSDRTFVALRSIDVDGSMGESKAIEAANPQLVGMKPDFVVLGHDGQAWRLLVQEVAPRRLATSIRQFRSDDGIRFEELAPMTFDAAVQLVPAPMRLDAGADGKPTLRAGVTRVLEKDVRAAVLTSVGGSPWQLSVSSEVESCNPLFLDGARVMVRDPKSLRRQVIGGASPSDALGFEGAPHAGAVVNTDGSRIVIAQSDPVHPNMLRRMVSCDGGSQWRRATPAWGGPAGTAGAVRCGESVVVIFEGGDKARRQHVLALRLPLSGEAGRCSNVDTVPNNTRSP